MLNYIVRRKTSKMKMISFYPKGCTHLRLLVILIALLLLFFVVKSSDANLTLNTCCNSLDLNALQVFCSSRDQFSNASNFSWSIPSHLVAENKSLSVRLKRRSLDCVEKEQLLVLLPLVFNEQRNVQFLQNGYLKVRDEFYHTDEFCIDGKNSKELHVKVCPQSCSTGGTVGKRPCIRKCCSLDKIYSFGNFGLVEEQPKGCVNPGSEYFDPKLYSDFSNPVTDQELANRPAPHFIEKYPSSFKYECPHNRTVLFVYPRVAEIINNITGIAFSPLIFRVREDGNILYRGPDGRCQVLNPAEHTVCIDGITNFDRFPGHQFKNIEDEVVIFLCTLPVEEGFSESAGSIGYGFLMILSSFFLLLTVIVYGLLWERQTVHGWTIVSHVASLFFLYIFVGTAHLMRVWQPRLQTFGCKFVGVASHFFWLSTFCWLLLISFDLWLTFRAIVPRSGTRSKGFSRYMKYSSFGWGVPALVIVVALVLDSKEYSENECGNVLKPAYGMESCQLQVRANGEYLYAPIGVMLGINLIFFMITTVQIYKYRESTKLATKDDTQQQFYRLFVKLFFVMGILWVFEVISWAVSGFGVRWYWVAFDLFNILRAVAIFIIFVCKPDIIFALETKYPKLKPLMKPYRRFAPQSHQVSLASKSRNSEGESVALRYSQQTKTSSLRSSAVNSVK